MSVINWLRAMLAPRDAEAIRAPRARHGATLDVSADGSVEEFLRGGGQGARTAAGVAVNADNAARVAAVYRCVALLSDPIGTMPIDLVRRSRSGVREPVEDAEFSGLLDERPNDWQLPIEFRSLMQRRVLMRGDAYARIVRNRGRVTDLIPLDPGRMDVRQLADWSLRYRYRPTRGADVELTSRDVLHLRNRSRDGYRGVSVLAEAREAIGTALATETHGATLFANGARPSGQLRTDQVLSTEAQARLQSQMDEHRGAANANKTLVLEQGLEFREIAMSNEDAQFIETRQFTRAEIATFFGVPPHMIGDTEKSTSWGAGIEQQTIGFVLYSLRPWITLWEQALKRSLLPGRRGVSVMFDVGDLLRGDAKAQAEYFARALQWGWLSPNEVRARLGMAPREGGDVYYLPPNETRNDSREGAPAAPADIGGALEDMAA